MDPQKKEKLNAKRRESYQEKKARSSVNTPESINRPSVLSQLQNTPIVTGAL